MAFQTVMNVTQAPAIAGDPFSVNPRHFAPTVPGGYVAGTGGLTIGLFAWADTVTGTTLVNTGTGLPTCFVSRLGLPANLVTYLQEYGMTIPQGFGIGNVFNGGDFWVKNAGASAVTYGMKAFANTTNGTISFAATGTTVAGSVETKWYAESPGAAGELIKMTSTAPG